MDTTLIIPMLAAQNAAQHAAIEEAHRQQCLVTMQSYDAATATAQQARAYAECVHLVYPGSVPPEIVLWLKVGVLAVILGPIIGAWVHEYDAVEGAMLGFLVPAGLWLVISLVVLGGWFVLWG